jgi:3-hydroxyisobutyrate dehydrogenase
MDKRIGWIGLGRMGEAMAKRLLKAGHKVSVWNRTAAKAAPLAEYGATIVAAKAGKLLQVASGPKALYTEIEPCLQAMARKVMWVGEGELARIWKIAHNTMFGVVIQNLCEITVMAEKAGIPRHIFLESINDSVLGSMYTRYKTPTLTNLTFDQVTFTPKLLLKDMDLGLAAARAYGVAMPAAAATRESVSRMVGRGHDDIDFAVLLQETAADAGLVLKSENVKMSDGLES